jgi:hypothetical protein
MAKVITIDPIQDPRWDEFVQEHPYGWICHLSGWKHLLEKSFKHMKGHYLAVVDDGNSNILAALPLFEVKSWLTGNRIVSIPFATLSDPLVSTREDMEKLLVAAIDLSNKLNTSYIEIRTIYADTTVLNEQFAGDLFYKYHYLQIDAELEEIRKKFHYKAVRYEINKAQKSGLTLRTANTESDLYGFYDLYIKTRKRLGLPPHPFLFLETLWKTFFPLNMIEILFAMFEDKIVGAQIYFKFKDHVSMEYEVWERGLKNMSPNHYLIWEAIKKAHAQGYRIFDFGRTSPENIALMNFKRRWGTQIVDLPQFFYPREAHLTKGYYHDKSMAHRLMGKICRNSPDFAFKLIGNFCYHHLG